MAYVSSSLGGANQMKITSRARFSNEYKICQQLPISVEIQEALWREKLRGTYILV